MATISQAAKHVFLSDREFYSFLDRGIITRCPKGGYDLDVVREECFRHYRERSAGRTGTGDSLDLADERARLAKEQADGHAIKNSQLRGELVPAAEMEAVMSRDYAAVRAGVLAVVSRVQQLIPGLSISEVAIFDSEQRQALQALGQDSDGNSGSGEAPVTTPTDTATEA